MDQVDINNPSRWEQRIMEKTLMATVKEHRRSRRWGIFFKLIILAYVLYFTFAYFMGKPKTVMKDHVALIDLIGEIGQGKDIEADHVATSLRRAFDESKTKAIIMRINSPGGSPVQSSYIYDEMRRLRGLHPEKKIYVVCMDICASGGYFIAAGADEVYANASSIIGSIGVLMPGFGFVDVMQKVGVQQRSITSGKDKLFLDPFSPENPEHVAYAKSVLGDVHAQFIKAVKDGRGQRLKETPENPLFTGLFWPGDKAMTLGLVDGLGSAGFVAREIIGIEEVIDYTVAHNFIDRITSRLGSSFSKEFAAQMGVNNSVSLK